MAYKRIQCKVLLTLFLIINTCFAGVLMEGDSLLVRENAHIEKLLMLDVTNEAMEADSILVKATDNYICNFPILKLPFFTESEIDSILLGKADTGHVHDTADVTNLSLYLDQKLNVSDTSYLARKIHGDRHLPGGPDDFFPSGTGGFLHYGDGVAQPASWEWRYPAVADVTGLQTALNGKLDVSDTTNFVWDSELDNYYTKTNLSTSGQASVHWNNITNEPAFITGVDWDEIGGDQSSVNVSGFNNDAGYLDALPSHDHDSRYPLKSLGRIRSGDTYEAMETDRNTLADGMYTYAWYSSALNRPADCQYGSALTFGGLGGTHGKAQLLIGFSSASDYLAYRSMSDASPWTSYRRIFHEGYKPLWSDIGSKPTVFPPEDHNHDTADVNNLSLYLGQKLDVTDTSDLARKIHNHDASDITSGTLSDSRLSFNPDYFVQGISSRRSVVFNVSNPMDDSLYSTFFQIDSDDPNSPSPNTLYGFRAVVNASTGYTAEIAGRAQTGELLFGGLHGGTRQPWREIWHSGNLDTANIAKLDANNVFTGVNTFSDTVKAAQIKPVNSNFIRIDLGQDVKNYGVNFRHIDAPHSEGAIGMYAKSYFDIKSDGLMQLISGEKVHIEGGDSVSISKNVNTIKMLMTTDNKVTIGKVQDTVLPLQRNSIDSLVVGRKYGGAYLVMGGESGPSISGYNNDFQPAPGLAGNITYDATKHNFNGDIVIGSNFYALNRGDTLIETGNIGDSAFVNIGKYFTVFMKGAVPGTFLGPYATCGNFAANGYVATPLVRNPNGAVIINNIMQCVEGLGVAIGGGLTVGNPTGGLKGAGTINAEAIYDDNVQLTGYVLDKAYNKDFKLSDWDTKEKEHVPARKFNIKADSLLDVNTYSAMLKRDKVLPAFKEMEESGEVESVGSVLQKLWETVETQAVHIAELNERIKMLEKAK